MKYLRSSLMALLLLFVFSSAYSLPNIKSMDADSTFYTANQIGIVSFTLEDTEKELIFVSLMAGNVEYVQTAFDIYGAKNFTLPFQAPEQVGSFELNLIVKDKSGHSVTRKVSLIVQPKTYDFLLNLVPDRYAIEKDTSAGITLVLANTGTEKNRFALQLPSGWNTAVERLIYDIDAGSVINVPLDVSAASDFPQGVYNYTMKVCSIITWDCKDSNTAISVYTGDSTLSSILVIPESGHSVVGSDKEFAFELKNRAPFTQQYTLSILSPDGWNGTFSFNEIEFTLLPNQEKEVTLSVSSSIPGEFGISYVLESSSVQKTGSITFSAEPQTITGMFVNTLEKSWFYGLVALAIIVILTYYLTREQESPYDSPEQLPKIPPV